MCIRDRDQSKRERQFRRSRNFARETSPTNLVTVTPHALCLAARVTGGCPGAKRVSVFLTVIGFVYGSLSVAAQHAGGSVRDEGEVREGMSSLLSKLPCSLKKNATRREKGKSEGNTKIIRRS